MKLSTGVRSIFSNALIFSFALGLQACGGGGSAPNAAPVFTSAATVSVSENTTATGYTVTATDAENNTITFSLTGGVDQARLSIDGTTGVLSFQTAEDFEAAADSDTNNSYVVDITATDGTNSVSQTVTVTVTDVNEAPVFTSGSSISVAENLTVTGYTAATTDPESNTVTYSVTGGTDQAQFSIDSTSGALSFQSATDFETPTDADANNSYIVEITATDGTSNVVQTVTATITNTVEITGYYDTGDISIAGTGNLQGMINGNRLMFYSSTSNLLYDGTLTITGSSYTATFTVYNSGLSPISATATGSFNDESSITGVITGGGVTVDGTFTLSFANTNDEPSNLDKVALPFVAWQFLLPTALERLIFDDLGFITTFDDFPVNGTYLANCVASSSSAAIEPIANTRLYNVSFTLSGCANASATIDGTYSGIATTFTNVDPDDRFLMFVTNSNKLVSIYDEAQPEPL